MNRMYRAVVALAVGALAVLAPTVASATPPRTPTATLAGTAACVEGGWQATFTFTNPSKTLTAVIVDVDGALDPAVPISVAPGAHVSDKTPKLTGKLAWLVVEYRWDRPIPTASPTTVSPTPTATVPAPGVPNLTAADRGKPHPGAGDRKTLKVRALVHRCSCPTPTPTTTAPTTPTATPTTTRPTATPTTSRPPSPSPTTVVPEPTITQPPLDGPASGGGLPLTGAPVAYAAAGGGALVVAGVVALLILRRRRTTFTA